MKRTSFITIAIIALYSFPSCGMNEYDAITEESFVAEDYYKEAFNESGSRTYNNEIGTRPKQVNASYNRKSSGGNGNIIMHPVKDPKTGRVSAYVPLPANWDVTGPIWKGPGNTMVQQQNGGSYLSSQKNISNTDQIIREEVIPAIRQQGGREGKIENHPAIAAFNENLYAQYVKYGQSKSWFEVKSIAFTDQQGMKGMVLVHLTKTVNNFGGMSAYQFQIMKSDAHQFEASKRALLYGLANMKMNSQAIAAFNQGESQRLASRDAAFNRKMSAQQAQFDSWMATQRSTSGDILDSGMDSWRRRNAMKDRGQEMTVDGIHGRTQVTSPYDGQTYKVDNGSNHYYMNQWGEYISTDDHYYNPNMDPGVNNQDWSEVQADDYNYNY